MKNFYKKISVSTGLFLLFFVLTFNSFAQEPPSVEPIWRDTSIIPAHTRTSLVFPTNPPDSTQVEGGYFNSYFNNMFSNLCPDGEVLAGFNPGAIDDSSPYKINTRWKLVCKSISSSDGLASGFTGSLVGSGNIFPIYNNDWTGLNNSILSQTRVDNQNWIKVDWTLTVNQDDDNSAFVAHFGRKNSANQFQWLSIFSYVPDRNRNSNLANNDFLSWASMLYSGLASKNFHITSADENSEMRFIVWNFSDPNKVKLKLTKNGLIYPQGAGSGKVLTSDANGLATWKNFSEIFSWNIFWDNCIKNWINWNVCYGSGALKNLNSWNNNLSLWYNSADKQIFGNNNISIGSNINLFNTWWNDQLNIWNWIYWDKWTIGIGVIPNTFGSRWWNIYDETQQNFNKPLRVGGNGILLWHPNASSNQTFSLAWTSFKYDFGRSDRVAKPPFTMISWTSHNWVGYVGIGWMLDWPNKEVNAYWINFYTTSKTDFTTNEQNLRMKIDQNGNVGIGYTGSLSNKLEVYWKVKIADGSQGSGKILVSDANGLARWETASLGGNPNDCSATNKSVNGHNYPIIGLTNGNSFLSNYIETITGGSRQWSQRFKCEKWYIITEGSEINSLVCNNGYISNGSACIQPSNDSKLGCSAMTMNINGREYSVPAIAHNFSAYAYSSSNIDNGHINYKQLFACNNWTITTSGTEEATSTTCSAGFGWNGNSCILSNNIEVTHAYSGTTCNTANIQVVNITPGIDKIPENLNADTMYKLEGGIYDVTKKINFNNCSAIVGAGTGATTVQYAGLSYGSEDLMNITKSDAVIDGLKIVWTKEGAGKVANVIRIKWEYDYRDNYELRLKNVSIRNIIVKEAVKNGIKWEYFGYSDFENIYITSISDITTVGGGYGYESYWVNIGGFNKLKFKNVSISNNNSTDSFYWMYLGGYNYFGFNSDFENISINNISGSSADLYWLHLNYDVKDNIFKNISINNISSLGWSSFWLDTVFNANDNNVFINISINNISSNRDSKGIKISSNNNYQHTRGSIFKNILINNIKTPSGNSTGISIYNYAYVSFDNFKISNISGLTSRWIDSLYNTNNNNFNNFIITNIAKSNYYYDLSYWIKLSDNNTINNISIFNSGDIWLNVSWNNNTIRNLISYKNKQDGINVTGSNNTFSNVYSYANGGAGIAGNGNSNFYYDKLQVFGNGWANNVGPLNRGLASHWLSGFNDGNFSDNSSFSANWAIFPTNVSGFNINTVGYQTGLTWPDKVDWSFGSSIPNQISPIIPSTCNISTNSTTKCRPEFGGTDTYNSLKKIWEW